MSKFNGRLNMLYYRTCICCQLLFKDTSGIGCVELNLWQWQWQCHSPLLLIVCLFPVKIDDKSLYESRMKIESEAMRLTAYDAFRERDFLKKILP